MNGNQTKEAVITDDCTSFEEFHNLNIVRKYELLNGISINLFAIACCRITNRSYLFELIDFMTDEQSISFIELISKVRELIPSRIFVKQSQEVIIDINMRHKEHLSLIMDFVEFSSISFAEGLLKPAKKYAIIPVLYSQSIH